MKKNIFSICCILCLFVVGCANNDTVPLQEYTKVVEEQESLKIELYNSVSKEEYDRVVKENESLKAQLGDSVSQDEYDRMVRELDELLKLSENNPDTFDDSRERETIIMGEKITDTDAEALDETLEPSSISDENNKDIISTESPQDNPQEDNWSEDEYIVSGNGVNIRLADNPNRVYTQLADGTFIGHVKLSESNEWAEFILDGANVLINKDSIRPVD